MENGVLENCRTLALLQSGSDVLPGPRCQTQATPPTCDLPGPHNDEPDCQMEQIYQVPIHAQNPSS